MASERYAFFTQDTRQKTFVVEKNSGKTEHSTGKYKSFLKKEDRQNTFIISKKSNVVQGTLKQEKQCTLERQGTFTFEESPLNSNKTSMDKPKIADVKTIKNQLWSKSPSLRDIRAHSRPTASNIDNKPVSMLKKQVSSSMLKPSSNSTEKTSNTLQKSVSALGLNRTNITTKANKLSSVNGLKSKVPLPKKSTLCKIPKFISKNINKC